MKYLIGQVEEAGVDHSDKLDTMRVYSIHIPICLSKAYKRNGPMSVKLYLPVHGSFKSGKQSEKKEKRHNMSALGIEPDIDLRDLLEISVSDSWSVQFSPLMRGPAGAQGGTFIRRAAPWKGLTKGDNESFGEYQDRLSQVNSGVAQGLGRARNMAVENAADGMALVERGGDVFPVPTTAANLMEAGSEPVNVLLRGVSLNQALQEMVNRTGKRPRFPTVY